MTNEQLETWMQYYRWPARFYDESDRNTLVISEYDLRKLFKGMMLVPVEQPKGAREMNSEFERLAAEEAWAEARAAYKKAAEAAWAKAKAQGQVK